MRTFVCISKNSRYLQDYTILECSEAHGAQVVTERQRKKRTDKSEMLTHG